VKLHEQTRFPVRRPSREEAAALYRLALVWRDEWRADVAVRRGEATRVRRAPRAAARRKRSGFGLETRHAFLDRARP
jgi:hypothetical protein